MTRWWAIALLLLLPAVVAAQTTSMEDFNTLRVSASAYSDSLINRAIGGIGFELKQAVPNRGFFTSSLSLVDDDNALRAGRGFARWEGFGSQGKTSSATVGTFLYQPQMFENRAGNVYMPAILVNGFQSQRQMGRFSVQAFGGSAIVEEGSRILYMRNTSDRIAGVETKFAASRKLNFGFQITRTRSNASDTYAIHNGPVPSSSVQLRQAVQWTPSSWFTFTGEYGVAKVAGRSAGSYDAAIEHDGARLNFRAAYVRRSENYLPFGLLSFSAGREGPYAEARYQLTHWLEFSGSSVKLRTPTTRSLQHNGNVSVRLPGNFQVTLARSDSRLNLRSNSGPSAHVMSMDSVTLTNSRGRWITRLRVDQIELNSLEKSRTRGVEIDETRLFRNGLSLSGEFRIQESADPAHRGTRVSTAIRGGYNWGNRVSLNVQTDFGRDIRNETVFATSNLRTSTASLSVKLTRSTDLRFEYYGMRLNYALNPQSILASTLLGNNVLPVLGGNNRNVFFVQFQKTIRWGRADSDQFAKATTGVTVMRPVGSIGGRVFIDENENGIWDEGERGVPNVVLALNGLRKTTTDESGRYEFAGVAVGPGEVSLEAESLNAIYTPVALRGPVSVVFRTRAESNFALLAGSSISGRIVENKGETVVPVRDAALRLEPSGLYAYTDADGEFSLSNVPRGQYLLSLVAETIEHPIRIVTAPESHIDIAHAGQQVKGIEFVVESIEARPEIERLPPARILVKSTSAQPN
jgi:hypothetical protein